MAGVEITKSPAGWDAIGGSVAGTAGQVLNGASVISAAMTPGLGWAQLGMTLLSSMLSGDSSQSATASGADGQLNTSGWVVGKGDAKGGGLTSTKAAAWPWYLWAGLAVVGVVAVRRFA